MIFHPLHHDILCPTALLILTSCTRTPCNHSEAQEGPDLRGRSAGIEGALAHRARNAHRAADPGNLFRLLRVKGREDTSAARDTAPQHVGDDDRPWATCSHLRMHCQYQPCSCRQLPGEILGFEMEHHVGTKHARDPLFPCGPPKWLWLHIRSECCDTFCPAGVEHVLLEERQQQRCLKKLLTEGRTDMQSARGIRR